MITSQHSSKDTKRLIAIIALLLLIMGCKNGAAPDPQTYKKGTDGLIFDFVNNAPPAKAFEDSSFTAATILRNKGGYDIEGGMLILNIESDYMFASDDRRQINLKGRSILNPNGDFSPEQFKVDTKKLEPLSERHVSQVTMTACYRYYAETYPNVCIDADYLSLTPTKKVCDVKDVSLTDQGGPLAVTKIEHKMIPSGSDIRAQFTIHVVNKGQGKPVDWKDYQSACISQPTSMDDTKYWNMVYVDEIKLSSRWRYKMGEQEDDSFTCKPNPLKLVNNEGDIVCTTSELSPESSYVTPLLVRLAYGYTESKSKAVEITKIK